MLPVATTPAMALGASVQPLTKISAKTEKKSKKRKKSASFLLKEYALIIEGAPEPEKTSLTLEEAAAQVKALRESGISVSDAAKQVAKQTGYKKGELYRLALEDENSTL